MEHKVIVYQNTKISYPTKVNIFRPSFQYPEYPFKNDISKEQNNVYDMVRKSFHMSCMDKLHYGTNQWNPLGDIIKPGNKVVVKPNLVMDFNPSGDGTDCLYTHPSVVAAIVDYIFIALQGRGQIIIGDAPMQECNFIKLIKQSGYDELINYYKEKTIGTKLLIELKDFRGYTSVIKKGVHHGDENIETSKGILVDLGKESEFFKYTEAKLKRLRINSYNPEILLKHHNIEKHEYLINEDVLNADVIINVPKPKMHRKAGVTIALKNLVGINVRKEYLPHHCNGDANSGGDEYNQVNIFKHIKSCIQDKINIEASNKNYKKAYFLVLMRKMITTFIRLSKDQSWDGSWYGNETISKTIIDLNKILLYCDKRGEIHSSPQRKIFTIADMIISGENEGPVEPTEKKAGLIAMGNSSVCFDEVITTLMGINIDKIPTLKQARNSQGKFKLIEDEQAIIISNNIKWNNKYVKDLEKEDVLHFVPAVGWKGKIEL